MAMTHHLLAALAALSTAVLAMPSSPPPPSYASPPSPSHSCSARSLALRSLSVSAFAYRASYTFSTPAHQIASGVVRFNLTNDALSPPASVPCAASSLQLQDFFYGDLVYHCGGTADDDGRLGATFAFSYPTGVLAVNETWWCGDEGARFEAEGAARLPRLRCEESRWQNRNWTVGQIYSTRVVTCTEAEASVPITSMSGVA